MSEIEDRIATVIQRVYNDASQTVLDRQCAREIVEELGELGWARPDWVRALVAAAGGEIKLSRAQLIDPPATLFVFEDYTDPSICYRIRVR